MGMFRSFLSRRCGLALLTLLAACSQLQTQNRVPSAAAEGQMARGDYATAEQTFEDAASHATRPGEVSALHLRAAEAAFAAHDPGTAQVLLLRADPKQLTPNQSGRYQVLVARCALSRGDAVGAYRAVSSSSPDHASAEQYLQIRGQALFALGQPVAATAALVLRENFLGDAAVVNENRGLIWSGLTGPRLGLIPQRALRSADPMTRGWIELAQLANHNATVQEFYAWRSRYPTHPGNARLGELLVAGGTLAARASAPPVGDAVPAPATPAVPAPAPDTVSPPLPPDAAAAPQPVAGGTSGAPTPFAVPTGSGLIALLLPHGGALAGVSDIVRQGFVAEIQREGGDPAQVKDYDSTDGAAGPAHQAVADGASIIVGPLRKENVVELAGANAPAVPVLALNYLDPGTAGGPTLFQFGLAPEDEAREAVRHAIAQGHHRAVALVPNTDWGKRVLAAFSDALQQQGGQLLGAGKYPQGMMDFSTTIKGVLGMDQSMSRLRALSGVLGERPEFTPSRRTDIDFIFIAARPPQARLIVPTFRFYHAENLPIYATSAINETRGNGDFYGVVFCDSPWLLRGESDWERYRTAVDSALAGQHRDLNRLYVMGSDAARLALKLRSGGLVSNTPIPALTGTLVVDEHGVVHRQLTCAAITGGTPRLLDDSAQPAPP